MRRDSKAAPNTLLVLDEGQSEPPRRPQYAEALPGLRILIVEDDALIGMLLGDMLEVMGHKVCDIEATEAGAVAAAARLDPEMMIVDAYLRDGSGISAVDHILRSGFVAHVFVSGDVRSVLKAKPGAVAIAKPFTEVDLARAISRARSTASI